MRDETLQELSEHFVVIIPLLQRHVFDKLALPETSPKRLPPAAYRVLMLVYELGCATVSDLSSRLQITRSNMSPLLDKLEKHEMIVRKSSETDRRIVIIELAPAGETLCRSCHEQMSQRFKEMLTSLEDEDLTDLSLHMAKLKSILIKASGENRTT
ncbi:MarR family transcriptional regulator [Paenibacillus sp. 1P07SE]|uniref:MarR family transcriptional regulator n=1 Tax=Paenibacillus sp. 1P07SE TaxID=3132209 RepID=UPI0039A5047E